ncbi:GNAT family N-acetyltransferase [Agromyces seonyuensis]|uniref:N-acetyltransferase n=1 Tax=Agromyces seonyuensis TaxID=2662446 RepID=A0A6I4NVA4_9MICO|nr:GNAT family N-acetyltransferase [Agromyces seonyuensis]MWB98386.1 N-acetyltransferase [Agromyces seonyuensis]
MAHVLAHEPDARRYTLHIGDRLASVLDYRVLGEAVSFVHTFTAPPYRGTGLAGELVEFAVDDVESRTGYRIVPSCWYVAEWFERHPERASLLSRRAG